MDAEVIVYLSGVDFLKCCVFSAHRTSLEKIAYLFFVSAK